MFRSHHIEDDRCGICVYLIILEDRESDDSPWSRSFVRRGIGRPRERETSESGGHI